MKMRTAASRTRRSHVPREQSNRSRLQGTRSAVFQSMRSAWAGGLHLRSRTDERRGAGDEVNTIVQGALIHDGYDRPWHATPGFRGTQTRGFSMEAILVSAGVIALAELGDKTQLLALMLAARFRAPVAVLAGIVTAVLVNHTLAGAAG